MKKLTNSKALLLLLVLVVCFVRPMKAQKRDGFFRNEELYENRTDGSLYFNLTNQHFGNSDNSAFFLYNQTFGQTAPLGEGLLIMIGGGVGYALVKRKRE